MNKTKIFCFLLFLSQFGFAQVGMRIDTSMSSLDVNENTMFLNELKVEGIKTTDGNEENHNDILVSQSNGNSPLWKNAKIGLYEEGEYKTISSFINTSESGLIFSYTQNNNILTSSLGKLLFTSPPPIPSKWKELSSSLIIRG